MYKDIKQPAKLKVIDKASVSAYTTLKNGSETYCCRQHKTPAFTCMTQVSYFENGNNETMSNKQNAQFQFRSKILIQNCYKQSQVALLLDT